MYIFINHNNYCKLINKTKRHFNNPIKLKKKIFFRDRFTPCDMIVYKVTRRHNAVTIPTLHLLLILAFTFLIPK